MSVNQLTSMMLSPAVAIVPPNPDTADEAETRRLIGLLVVLGMVALILKGLLLARWFKARKRRSSR
jgi:hypothetical protein